MHIYVRLCNTMIKVLEHNKLPGHIFWGVLGYLGCLFKSRTGWVGYSQCFLSPHSKVRAPPSSPHPASRGQHDGLRLCHRLPRGMGPLPEAGVLPPVPSDHHLRLHRNVDGFSGRNAAPPLPHPRASQPDTRVGEQQHSAGGGKRRRRSAAQPLLQVQTYRLAAFFPERLAAC